MDRLGPVDAMFLELEKSGPPVAVGAVSEIDGEAPDVDAVRDFVAGRISACRGSGNGSRRAAPRSGP